MITIKFRMIGTDNTPVTEANIRRSVNADAEAAGLSVSWDGTVASITVETPKDRRQRGLSAEQASAEHRVQEATLQRIFQARGFKVA